jgi:predicted MFS family arabinose efflux permease
MLAAFLFSESRATEPIIPLLLFRNPVIAICSACAFFLGVGMFGVIIYLPLFMQGVLRVSATQSGNLLTPLMMGAVVRSITSGQTVSRTGKYKAIAIAGSVLVAMGMAFFARMSADTTRLYVVYGMVIAGLGMGLLQPVYTIAVQNVAPRKQMGAATSSTIFFRSIGSTVGVATFGSMMLTRYHAEFERTIPAHVPEAALPYFYNPLLLVQARPQLEAALQQRARRHGDVADAVCQCPHGARERAAPGLCLGGDHHGRVDPAAPDASKRAAAHAVAQPEMPSH